MRGAALAGAIARLEERFGSGVVLPGGARETRAAARTVAFGLPSLDALLEGGLVAGEPQVLAGEPSSGALTIALSLVRSAQSAGGEVAWLDPARSFDPLAAATLEVDLARLLVVRADQDDLAFAASVLARSSAFVLVVLDIARADVPVDALATVLARARAARVSLLVLGGRATRVAAPVASVRRREWLREKGRLVGWRSEVTRPHDARVARLTFAPLALPPREVVDEGLAVAHLEALA